MKNKNWILNLFAKSENNDIDDYRDEHMNMITRRKQWANSTKALSESLSVWEDLPEDIKNYIEKVKNTGSLVKDVDKIINNKAV
jgi:hypothetical protein